MIVEAPRYVPNTLIRRELQMPSVKEAISHYSSQYSARLTAHPNGILLTLLTRTQAPATPLAKRSANWIYGVMYIIII
jgi:hypothetical protein